MRPDPVRPTTTPQPLNRRQFLTRSLVAGAAWTLIPGCVTRPGGASSRAARLGDARPRVAVVGIGNRGNDMVKAFANSGLVDLTAFCDVDLSGAHTAEVQAMFPDVPKFRDYRELFDEHGDLFDAVVICTPDHTHFPVAMQAMRARKHVYLEKPLAHTFQEIELLMAMARESGVVTQMGNQGHSGNNFHQFKAWAEAGVIRDVTKVVAFMNSPRRWHGWVVDGYPQGQPVPPGMDWDLWHGARPLRPFSEQLHPGNWRSWYDFGNGAFGDWGPHILDTVHRFLELGLPHTIEAVRRDGVSPFIFPQASTIRFDFPARGSRPPVEVFWYDGVQNRPPLPDEMTEAEFKRTNGKFIYSRDLVFQGGTHSDTLRIVPEDKMRQLAPELPRVAPGFSDHVTNFVRACQGREEAQSPFDVSGPLSQVFALGVIAQHIGGRLEFDPVRKRFRNSEEANRLLVGPAPRRGWAHYYRA